MKSLRIISGSAGGLRIKSVPGTSTRPITDKVKEALFNILGSDILDCKFLDLFAGTGSVGIEGLSRGARFARFIEVSSVAVNIIKDNLNHTKLMERAEVIHADALRYIKKPADNIFDYLYIAPPQYKQLWLKALHRVDENPNWLSMDGQLIIQIHPIEYETHALNNFIEIEQRHYGSTILVFYNRR